MTNSKQSPQVRQYTLVNEMTRGPSLDVIKYTMSPLLRYYLTYYVN